MRKATPKRARGAGGLFQRAEGGPWIARLDDGSGRIRDKSTRTNDRAAAEVVASEWARHAVLVRAGLAKPEGGTMLDRHGAGSLDGHLSAFMQSKRSEGRSARHLYDMESVLRATGDALGWRVLSDLAPDALERLSMNKQAPSNADARAWTPRTASKAIGYWRAFARWCVADGRLAVDPLARVKRPAALRQRERRYLSPDEWQWLAQATENGPDRHGMPGPERALFYRVAIETGLRSNELRSLTRSSLHLSGATPFILAAAHSTKNRKPGKQYLRPATAAALDAHARRMLPGSRVFALPHYGTLARMLRADLSEARRLWIDGAGDDARERITREGSDFLLAENHDGQHLDLHALRHTCGVWLAMGGASPKAIQSVLRHSTITLTMDTYGHLLPDEGAGTVHRMPDAAERVLRLAACGDVPPQLPPQLPTYGAVFERIGGPSERTTIRSESAKKWIPASEGGRITTVHHPGRSGGMADAADSKSADGSVGCCPATVCDAPDSLPPQVTTYPPDLQRLIERWDDLPEAVRAGILAIVSGV
jgi:integrase